MNLKTTATAAIVAPVTDTGPPGSLPVPSLVNPALYMIFSTERYGKTYLRLTAAIDTYGIKQENKNIF